MSLPAKTARLREVADAVGVSVATVSNTVNRPHLVAAATRDRVLAAIEELGFVPHLGASSLKKGQSRLIGLVLPDITNSFYAEIARGVLEAAHQQKYAVVLCNSQDDPQREKEHLQMLAEQRAAGALVVPLSADQRRLDQLQSLGAHLVMIDRAVPDTDGCSVSIDDVHGGRIAVQHLIGTRGDDIVLVNGHDSIRQCDDRRSGARSALADAHAGPDRLVEHVVDEMTTGEGERIGRLIGQTVTPAGVFCTNDQLAIGVIRGLASHGLRVPEDVAVVGYGNLSIAVDAPVPLTSVDQSQDSLGRLAVGRLLSEMTDQNASHRHTATVLQPAMVLRQSAP